MKSKKALRIASVALASVIGVGAFSALAGCTGTKDALVIMTQELNGLYNPFYSTAGTDMDVVGQTQISMFSTKEDGTDIAYGDDEAVVVKDFKQESVTISEGTQSKPGTRYYFVIKKGIQFSDGVPLTINDVMFNLYVYLDPTYTGSSTMYSTDIVGLQNYRTQTIGSSSGTETEDSISESAAVSARMRRAELEAAYIQAYRKLNPDAPSTTTNYEVPIDDMRDYILNNMSISEDYYDAIWAGGVPTDAEGNKVNDNAKKLELGRKQLLADYNAIVGDPDGATEDAKKGLYRLELETDFSGAKDAFANAPYCNVVDNNPNSLTHGQVVETNSATDLVDFRNELVCFMYLEGYITLAYEIDAQGNENRNHIVKSSDRAQTTNFKTSFPKVTDRESAIDYVYGAQIENKFLNVLYYSNTGSTVYNNYVGQARDVILHNALDGKEGLVVPNVTGIRSLAHTKDMAGKAFTIGENTYEIATAEGRDAYGVPDGDTYDVLEITINGVDPKAKWNFGFTVAPWHYYSDADHPVDIANNDFGVEYASFDFHTNVLQGVAKDYKFGDETIRYNGVNKNKVPLGAGPYAASNRENELYPRDSEFFTDNVVYYTSNEYFFADVKDKDESLHAPYIKKMRYQVISSTNALGRLENKQVDFVEPQMTDENLKKIESSLSKKGFMEVDFWQLGYGYIGVNATYVQDINLRKAIMAAMDTTLALQYYRDGMAVNISWPMSVMSWAYPRTAGNKFNPADPTNYMEADNECDYAMFSGDESAKKLIKTYMDAAEGAGNLTDQNMTLKFTIAGSNLTDHPCYLVFKHAADLLNGLGWHVEVVPDTYALTKLATGSLAVWAAAWGSTIDPDMYQVYHKNSTASSVKAWGYPSIKSSPSTYAEETTILNTLSELIDDAREIENQEDEGGVEGRISLYKKAMEQSLALAVELPVYQRKTMYAFNANTIDVSTLNLSSEPDNRGHVDGNSFSSPLAKIWEVKLKTK